MSEESLEKEIGKLLHFTEYLDDAYLYFDTNLIVRFINSKAESVLGIKRNDILNKKLADLYDGIELSVFYLNCRKALEEQRSIKSIDYYPRLNSWLSGTISPTSNGLINVFRDITDTYSENLHDSIQPNIREVFMALRAEIVEILDSTDKLLPQILQECVQVISKRLRGKLVRIWLYNKEENVLDLTASIGVPTLVDLTKHPVDKFTMGRIATSKKPFFNDDLSNLKDVADKEWARNEDINSFAGYPLLDGERLLGVIGIFLRDKLDAESHDLLALLVDLIAQGIVRYQAQEELKQEQDFLKTVTENMSGFLTVLDKDGRIIQINPAYEKFLGYTSEELKGKHIWDYVIPSYKIEEIKTHFASLKPESFPFTAITKLQNRKGEFFYTNWSNSAFLNEDGSIKYIIGNGEDLTEKLLAEKALKESEDKLREEQDFFKLVAQNMSGFLCMTDKEGRIILSNASFERFSGYPAEEVKGKYFWELTAPKDAKIAKEIVRQWTPEAFPYELLTKFENRSGEIFDIFWSVSAVLDEDGSIKYVIGTGDDLTERLKTQHALKESKEKLREEQDFFKLITENMNTFLTVTDKDGRMILSNTSFERFSGYTIEEVKGKYFWELTAPDDVEKMEELTGQWTPEVFPYEVLGKMNNRSGETFDVLWSANAVLDEDGSIKYVIGNGEDQTEKLKIERALKESEEKLREEQKFLKIVTENMNNFLTVTDKDGRNILFNSSYEKFLGYTTEEIKGKYFWELAGPEDVENMKILASQWTPEAFPYEVLVKVPDQSGEISDIFWSVNAYLNEDGSIKYIIGNGDDQTERVKTQQALKESENNLREERNFLNVVMDTMTSLLCVMDHEGRIIQLNTACEELFGYKLEEVQGKYVWEHYVPAPLIDEIKTSMENWDASYFPFRQKGNWIGKDGTEHYIDWANNVFLNEDGSIKYVVAGGIDLSESLKAEKIVRESEERLRTFFNSSLIGVGFGTSDGGISDANDAFLRMIGYDRDELTTLHWDKITPEEFIEVDGQAIKTYFETGRLPIYEKAFLRKDGSRVPVMLAGGGTFDKDGTMAVCFLDLTEQKETEKALEESEQRLNQSQKMDAIGRLAGGVAHDFNNLLTVISGYSEIALRKVDGNASLQRNLEEINKAGQRAAALTRQLLAFSRKQVLNTQNINLNKVILDVEAMLKRLIREDIEFIVDLDPMLYNIRADHGQIEQVLLNLAVNARDAMPDGGRIHIETKNVYFDNYLSIQLGIPEGWGICLAFSDTGTGISDDVQEKMFEPFFTTKTEGTGLGLSTVYGIVMQFGGSIKVISQERKGTTFFIYFPQSEAKEKVIETKLVEEAGHQATETILIVEDEDMVRQLALDTLSIYGYNLLLASNGREALNLLEKGDVKIDLILTDVVMPEINGIKLIENVRQTHPEISVLFMSGYTALESGSYEAVLNSENFIQKPFSTKHLAKKVQNVLDARTDKKLTEKKIIEA